MKIEYYTQRNYGTDCKYIKDEKIALAVRQLTGQKTLSDYHITGLISLGNELIEVLK